MATWELAGKARNDFADMIELLTPEQLTEQSLCGEWTAEGVLAHLASLAGGTALGLIKQMFRSRFDFDKVSVAMAKTHLERPMDQVLTTLRTNATKSAPLPSFPEEMSVTDVAIHTQDVRRPLGLPGDLDESILRTALDFLTTHKKATLLIDRRAIDGLRFEATDIGWSFGEGDEIIGTAEAIMMGLANRPVLNDLTGDGLSAWRL